MAFTGSAVFSVISRSCVRITGLSLASAAAGTIGFDGGTGEVDIPAACNAAHQYTGPFGDLIGCAESVQVSIVPAAVGVATAIPVSVVKTGDSKTSFLATLTNTHGSLATPDLEIYVTFLPGD